MTVINPMHIIQHALIDEVAALRELDRARARLAAIQTETRMGLIGRRRMKREMRVRLALLRFIAAGSVAWICKERANRVLEAANRCRRSRRHA